MTVLYFITGTDTDCGKTYVTTQLLQWLHAQGKTAQAIKPVASGCYKNEGELINPDIEQLQKYNGDSFKSIHQWLFEEPIAPHIAAQKKDIKISAKEIALFCRSFVSDGLDYLLIEGAGGLLVPLNDTETWVDVLTQDVLKPYGLSVIVVVGVTLGCINHALLTESYLLSHHLPCAGFILNEIDKDCLEKEAIKRTLTQKMNIPLISSIPYCGNIVFFSEG